MMIQTDNSVRASTVEVLQLPSKKQQPH